MAIDKSKDPPLHIRVGDTEGWDQVVVKRNGVVMLELIEVDVLGCWARRWQRNAYGGYILDDDGVACTEVIYGFYSVEWRKDDEEYIGPYGFMGPFG